jgi:hypothetical protein
MTRKTPDRFRTRTIAERAISSSRINKKHAEIKQRHKLDRALRTATTINDAHDFGVGKRLHNLGQLREIGFCANRRLLDVWSGESYVIHPKCEKTDQNRYGRKAHVGQVAHAPIESS